MVRERVTRLPTNTGSGILTCSLWSIECISNTCSDIYIASQMLRKRAIGRYSIRTHPLVNSVLCGLLDDLLENILLDISCTV